MALKKRLFWQFIYYLIKSQFSNYIETIQLIWIANQLAGFNILGSNDIYLVKLEQVCI